MVYTSQAMSTKRVDKHGLSTREVENSLVGGFVRTCSDSNPSPATLAVQAKVADELSKATANVGLEMEIRNKSSNPNWRGKGIRKGRKLKLATVGIPKRLLDNADPDYRAALEGAGKYRKYRSRELSIAHGYVSAGASSLLTSAALALAASRYIYGKVCENGDLMLLKMASLLADSARQNELAAWELAAREGTARRKAAMADQGVPWLANVDGGKNVGGRPRNAEFAARDAEREAEHIPPMEEAVHERSEDFLRSEAEPGDVPIPPPGESLMGWVMAGQGSKK